MKVKTNNSFKKILIIFRKKYNLLQKKQQNLFDKNQKIIKHFFVYDFLILVKNFKFKLLGCRTWKIFVGEKFIRLKLIESFRLRRWILTIKNKIKKISKASSSISSKSTFIINKTPINQSLYLNKFNKKNPDQISYFLTNFKSIKLYINNVSIITNIINILKKHILNKINNVAIIKKFSSILICQSFLIIDCHAISLNELIDYSMQNNQELIIAKSKLANTQTANEKTISEFLPNIFINFNNGNRRIKADAIENFSQNGRFYSKEIQLEQSISNGLSSYINLQKNQKIYLAELFNYFEKKQQISFEIIKLVLLREMFEKNLKNLQKISEIYHNIDNIISTKIKFKKSTKQDLIANDNEKLSIELQINQHKVDLSENLLLIKNLTNYQDLDYSIVNLQEIDLNQKIPALDFLTEMIEFNNSLQAKYLSYQALNDEINIKKSAFAPQVSLVGNIAYQKNNLYTQGQKNYYKSIAINIKMPIFQKGAEYIDLRDINQKKDISLQEFDLHKKSLISEITKFYHQFVYYTNNQQICNEIIESWQKKINISRIKIDKKISDLGELYKHQISYYLQKNTCNKYSYEALILLFKIKSIIGDLYV